MEGNATSKKRVCLTARESYRLAEAVQQEADRLRREQPSLIEAAAELTRSLGFEIGPSSIKTAMQVTGVNWDASARSRRPEPNWIDIDVRLPDSREDGPAALAVEPCRRPRDRRICGVTVPRHAPPAESAAWLRRLADLLDRHGAEVRAVKQDETDDPADVENDEKVRVAWNEIVAAHR